MLIEDIVSGCAKLLNLSVDEDGKTDKTDEEKLLLAVSFIIDEVARDYIPLIENQTIKSDENGKILYSAFGRIPTAVISVKCGGKTVDYLRLHDGIKTQKHGMYEIRYAFKPAETHLDGQTEWEDGIVPLRTLAYGAAAEYCIMCGFESDAEMWDKRYRDSLERAVFHFNAGRKIPARRWET